MANNQPSDLIETAFNEAIKSFEDYEDGDILVEWVIIGYVTSTDKDKGSMYPQMFSNGNMPTHAARGLLITALKGLDND